jgi:hypothetical protein
MDHTRLMADLAEICEASPDQRKVLINLFLARCHPWHESLARHLARYPGLNKKSESVVEDLVSLVMEAHSDMVAALGSAPFSKPAVAWEAQLFTRARSAIRDYAESSAVTGIAGYTPVNRRRRGLYTTAQRMEIALGRPATNAEVCAEYNKAAARRSDPIKQAAYATDADFVGLSILPSDPDGLPEYSAPTSEDDFAATDAASRVVDQIIKVCYERDPRWGRIAEISLDWFPDGEKASQAEVSRRTGIPASTVKVCMEHIRKIMVDQATKGGLLG